MMDWADKKTALILGNAYFCPPTNPAKDSWKEPYDELRKSVAQALRTARAEGEAAMRERAANIVDAFPWDTSARHKLIANRIRSLKPETPNG